MGDCGQAVTDLNHAVLIVGYGTEPGLYWQHTSPCDQTHTLFVLGAKKRAARGGGQRSTCISSWPCLQPLESQVLLGLNGLC